MSNQLHDLVVLSFSFAAHTLHVRNTIARAAGSSRRMGGPGYQYGMSADRVNQFKRMCSVRRQVDRAAQPNGFWSRAGSLPSR